MSDNKIHNLITEAIKKTKITRQNVRDAIKFDQWIAITGGWRMDGSQITEPMEMEPTHILDGNLIVGVDEEGVALYTYLSDVASVVNSPFEASKVEEPKTEDIKIPLDKAVQMDPTKLSKLALKNPVTISEKELEEDTTYVANDEQQQSIYNLKSWASELGLNIGQGTDSAGDVIRFDYQNKQNEVVTILIFSSGEIKISGHSIKSLEDLKKIVEFLNDIR